MFLFVDRSSICKTSSSASFSQARNGLTLVEILVALTMTLIILGAMMAAFGRASEAMRDGRAIMELANRARTTEDQLRSDLSSLTVDPKPYSSFSEAPGYLEYVERARRDATEVGAINSYLGDVDDILAMTIRSRDGVLFRGRGAGPLVESSLAEVIWYTSVKPVGFNAAPDYTVPSAVGAIPFESTVRLHRRQLLIRPDLNVGGTLNGATGDELLPAAVDALLANVDISCRVVPGATAGRFDVVANNLTDLARRENRYAHVAGGVNFPNPISAALLASRSHSLGEDILLTDVASFDVRVYSPDAPVYVDPVTNVAIEPGDAGYLPAIVDGSLPIQGVGAFVDLNWAAGFPVGPLTPTGWFAGTSSGRSQCSIGTSNLWDTWSPSYEADGIDQDGSGVIDQATNGVNDLSPFGANLAAPDDNGERETAPPYATPIRGLEVKIRLIEKGTKKVFQTSVVQSFVPE